MTSRTRSALRSFAVFALAAAGLVAGCGKSPDASASGGAEGTAAEVAERVNETMRKTSFHASGTTTAFVGAEQETWWDPEKGLRMKTTGGGVSGEMYCKDGTSYISAPLFADMLEERGQNVTVPDRLADVFVTTGSGQGCDAYFAVSDTAEFLPEEDTTVGGTAAKALKVYAGTASDTYFVADGDTARLLRLDSLRNGRRSTTTYDSFGDSFSISIPPKEKTMSLEAFRREAGAE
ncbi:hypothetical protein BJP40_18095 [Streptomyces sp. CC53]|uniref:hypothetical protein n=1 Tax=unclassified Streptomyces TaxID=2593676 RepID=UPI0008DD2ADE|nr:MULTISPECIES: hypothetical protein [unclassified Streptomyces]OII65072.1 hypothetical protein BJP40_18095 [Streptomyces sp. CC53]